MELCMSEFYTEYATLADIPFLMAEFEDGARRGHFSREFLSSKSNKVFEKQIREAIRTNQEGKYSGHFIYIVMRDSDDTRAGIIWLYAALDPSGAPCLELRAVSIIRELQGKGYGSKVVTEMLESNPSHAIMAKCYHKSTRMADMLKRRGFRLIDTSPSGTQLLYRDPQ